MITERERVNFLHACGPWEGPQTPVACSTPKVHTGTT